MAQPLADLQFAHHSIGEELLPGTDLFSEPHRVHLGTTVSSLKFLCHWLYTKGFYTTVLTHSHPVIGQDDPPDLSGTILTPL